MCTDALPSNKVNKFACSESIRTKYRLIRNRSINSNRSTSRLSENRSVENKLNKRSTKKRSFSNSKYPIGTRTNSASSNITVYVKQLNIKSKKPNYSICERMMRRKKNQPTDHTFSTINLIGNLKHVYRLNLPAQFDFQMQRIKKRIAKLLDSVERIFRDFRIDSEFSIENFIEIILSKLQITNSIRKLIEKLNFYNLILFVSLMICFELLDLYFIFLKNFHSFSIFYLFLFTIPLSIVYHLNNRKIISAKMNNCERIVKRHQKRKKSTKTIDHSKEGQTDHQNYLIKRNLILVNKIVSMSLICLIDLVMIRNNLRLLFYTKLDDEVDLVYLIDTFVDNLVNYDQPKFNYLPEEENASATRLNCIGLITIFYSMRLIYDLIRLLGINELVTMKNDHWLDCEKNDALPSKNHVNLKETRSTNTRQRNKDYQKESNSNEKKFMHQIDLINTFFNNFIIISMKSIIVGLLAYNSLYMSSMLSLSSFLMVIALPLI